MRRWTIGLAMAVGVLGGCAEASRDFGADADPGVQRIESFIAAQRAADSRTCSERGYDADTIGHRLCVRELAAQRRAAIEGASGAQEPRARPAGWCHNGAVTAVVRCQDI